MSIASEPKGDVLWVTNNAPPYRRPVWRSLAAALNLEVLLLATDEGLTREVRRGDDWFAAGLTAEKTFMHRVARTVRLSRGERTYFILRESARALTRGRSAILLGGWESPAYWQLLWSAPTESRLVGFYESTLASNRYTSGPIAWARGHFYRRMDAVVVPGPAAAAAVRSMGVAERRIFVGFNAVDIAPFLAVARSGSSARPGQHRYIYVGQLIERKNVDGLIEAFARVSAGTGDELTIVGDGDQRSALESLASRLGVSSAVRFAGSLPNSQLPALLAQADTLVLPSKEEVWGLVVNEALAAGCQVVVSEHAGVAASVVDMPGVFATRVEVEELICSMRAARRDYVGRFASPQIAAHTPESFASTFRKALDVS